MTSGNRKTRFSRNVVANLVRFGSITIVSFVLSPYIVSKLGASGYGVWTLIAGLVGYLVLLDFGVRQSINKYVAEYQALGKDSESSLIVSTALKIFSVAGIIAIALSGGLAVIAPHAFNIPDHLVEVSQQILVLGGITIAVSLYGGVFGGVVSGVQRFDVQCVIDVLVTLVRAGGTVWALETGGDLLGMALVHLGAAVLSVALYVFACRQLYPQMHIVWFHSLQPYLSRMARFASAYFLLSFISIVVAQSANVIIGASMPIEAVAFFAIAAGLAKQAASLTEAISHLMTPRISAMASTGGDVAREVTWASTTTTLLICPVALTLLVRGETFISLWMGEQFGQLSGTVLSILSVVLFVGAARSVFFHSITGLAKHSRLARVTFAEAVAIIGLSIVLVREMGVIGVAIATLVPNVIASLWFFPRILSSVVPGIRSTDILLRAVVQPLLVCLPFVAATVYVDTQVNTPNLFVFFLQTGLLCLLIPPFAWFFLMSENDRAWVRARVGF